MNQGALWLAGIVILVLLLENVPQIGGAVLILLVVYLASVLTERRIA